MNSRKAKKEATIEHILSIAEHIFAQRGLIAPSIQEIARAAGMSKQALMHHFPSKERLWIQVIERVHNRGEMLFSLLITILTDPKDQTAEATLLRTLERPQTQRLARFLLRAFVDEQENEVLDDRSLVLLNQQSLSLLTSRLQLPNDPQLYLRFSNLNLLLLSTLATFTTKNIDLLPVEDAGFWRRQQLLDVLNLYKDAFRTKKPLNE